MLSGVLLSSWSYLKSEKFKTQETQFWVCSIALAIIGLVLFSIGTATTEEAIKSNSIIFTFANAAYLASIVFQTLFCISLRKFVSVKTIYLAAIGVVIFAMHFEYLRGSGNFVGRVLEVACIISVLSCIQIYQLKKVLGSQPSIQLKFLFIFTLFELVLVILRVVVSALQVNPVLTIEAIPMSLMAILWLNLAFNVLSYLTMLGFWSERSTAKQVAISLENERISALLLERDKLVSSLLTANKSAATGALSASLAHELNQPIGASRINLYSLKKALDGKNLRDTQIHEIIGRIDNDNERAGKIVSSLRSIFTQEGDVVQNISLMSVIDSVVDLIRGECNTNRIELIVQIEDAQISINRVELQQVLLNLLNNAIDALKSEPQDYKRVIHIKANKSSEKIELTVSDNGPGVPALMTSRIFELFQTQKDTGMGIGLWLSRYIVERFGGQIAYSPNEGRGSKFIIHIPLKRDMG